MSRLRVLTLITLASLFCVLCAAQNPTSSELPEGAMQAKAVTSCTECHEARIVVQQRLGKPAWTKEVDKMIKWGAVVDAQDHDPLIDYLSTNFGTDKPEYIAEHSRTAATKKR
jgi:hypothetical protein